MYRSKQPVLLRWPILALVIGLALGGCASAPVAQPPTASPPPLRSTVAPPATRPTGAPEPTAALIATPAPTPYVAPIAGSPALSTRARGYLTTPGELAHVAELAQAGQQPYQAAVQQVLAYAAEVLDGRRPRPLNEINIRNDDVDKPLFLRDGGRAAYTWAIAYNLLKDRQPGQAEEYARAAHELIMDMPRRDVQVTRYQDNTRLNIAVHMPNFVYAADLLADWTPPGGTAPFADSADAQQLKTWLGAAIIRYPYNGGLLRVNNWGAWGRLTTAVIADYVGNAAPLYVQRIVKNTEGAYEVDPAAPCDPEAVDTCIVLDAGTLYAGAIQQHFDMVDGRAYEFSDSSCDASGSKSMIRPDGGIPDEIRRQYGCDTTQIKDPEGPAARYSQFALEPMVSLAELAWRRGDSSLYTHIDAATGRGALDRALMFLIDNEVLLTRSSMLEMMNRFYTYQAGIEQDSARRAEYQRLLAANLPGLLKREGDWPAGVGFVSFGTLTHGFAAGEAPLPPPVVPARVPA